MSLALGAQNAKRVRRNILSSVVYPAVQYFPTFSHKGCGLLEKVTESQMWVLIFSTNFVRNISHSKKNSARYYHKCTYIGLHVKCRYSWQILMKLTFSRKDPQMPSFVKILSAGAECFHADGRTGGRTDMTRLIVAFLQFCESAKNGRVKGLL